MPDPTIDKATKIVFEPGFEMVVYLPLDDVLTSIHEAIETGGWMKLVKPGAEHRTLAFNPGRLLYIEEVEDDRA